MVVKRWGDHDSVALYSMDIDILHFLADTEKAPSFIKGRAGGL